MSKDLKEGREGAVQIPGLCRENRWCKGPEAGMPGVLEKVPVAGAEQARGRVEEEMRQSGWGLVDHEEDWFFALGELPLWEGSKQRRDRIRLFPGSLWAGGNTDVVSSLHLSLPSLQRPLKL